MDNLTHTLTGLALGRAGLNRWCPRAPLIAMLGANAPDLDVVTALGGSPLYLEYHRHATHSLYLAPLVAVIPVLITRLFGPVAWLRAFAVSLLAVLSHQLLDWTNIYGTRLLWPQTSAWLRLDITPVVDPYLLAVLFLAAAAPWFSRLVGSEIGESRRPKFPGTGWAVTAILFVFAYNYARSVTHDRAVATLESRIYDGRPPAHAAAFPNFWSPLRWRGLVVSEGGYRIFDLNLVGGFDPAAGQLFFDSTNAKMRVLASQTRAFEAFLGFVQYPLWLVTPTGSGQMRVQLYDLRFGDPRAPGFVATAIVDEAGRVRESSFTFGQARPR